MHKKMIDINVKRMLFNSFIFDILFMQKDCTVTHLKVRLAYRAYTAVFKFKPVFPLKECALNILLVSNVTQT